MNCRGHQRRIEIVEKFDMEVIAHIRLLEGRTIHSDAEREIKNHYFIFECTSKETGNSETIYCGSGAARDFFLLTNRKAPPIFNPLVGDGENRGGGNNGGNDKHPSIIWNPAAKQLYNAIMLLIIFFDSKPNQALFKLKKQAEQYYGCVPYAFRVRAVNTILRKTNRRMSQVVATLSEDNHMREYQFNLLEQILKDEKEDTESYF